LAGAGGWNTDLRKLKKDANKAFHAAYKTRSEADWDKHREARRAFKKLVRQYKRSSWQDFSYTVEGTCESA